MKILHFSDIHTGGKFSSIKALFDKRIIGTLNYKLRRKRHVHWERLERAIDIIKEEKPDYVINTGDISSVSEPAEFAEALERLKPLIEDQSFKFLNIPGNHDYYTHNNNCLQSRNSTFLQLNRGLHKLEDFPIKLEEEDATFILVDESRPNPGTLSSGILKESSLKKISNWTEKAQQKPIIFLGHYPLLDKLGQPLAERRCLENSEALLEILENGKINVTLCGHIHSAFSRTHSSGSMEVCAGSLTIGGKMNKLEYDKSTKKFTQSWIDLR